MHDEILIENDRWLKASDQRKCYTKFDLRRDLGVDFTACYGEMMRERWHH